MAAYFAKGLSYFAKVLSFRMKMPGTTHPTRQLFIAVHLVCYESDPILCSVSFLSRNPWEAPDWQMIAVDADVKQVITSWLQTLDNSVFTLEHKTWYHCGANAEMVVVTTLRSDVYHLLHMFHILIKVPIKFWHECSLPYFLIVVQYSTAGKWWPNSIWIKKFVSFIADSIIFVHPLCNVPSYIP